MKLFKRKLRTYIITYKDETKTIVASRMETFVRGEIIILIFYENFKKRAISFKTPVYVEIKEQL